MIQTEPRGSRWIIRTAKSHRQSGMALIGTMLVLMTVFAVMLLGSVSSTGGGRSGVMTSTTNTIQGSKARTESVGAFNMAESGVDVALQWISGLPSPPIQTVAFAPDLAGGVDFGSPVRTKVIPDPTDPGSYFTVEVYPDSSNITNQQKKYVLESVGVSGGMTQIVRAYVEQSSLSKWLVLLDRWDPPNNYWVSGLSTFDGPVHDNNSDSPTTSNGQPENVLWQSAQGAPPLFTYTGDDAYTISGANVNWYKDSWWTQGAPQTEADWHNVAVNGASSVHTGSSRVPFPTTSDLQQTAALGGTAVPNAVGVTVPTSGGATVGGIYVHGDVDTMTLSIDPSDSTTQIVDTVQTDGAGNKIDTKVTMSKTSHSTTVLVTTTSPGGVVTVSPVSTFSGTGNGVVYSDGNIGGQGDPKTGGLSGVVADNVLDAGNNVVNRSSLTIATDASKNMNLAANVTYHTQRQRDSNGVYLPESADPNFTKNAGTIGLISNNVLLNQYKKDGTQLNNFEMDGTVLAYGIYDADHWWDRAVGVWENMGSYLSKVVGCFGYFGGDNNLITGFNTTFNYDARMRDTPPPYFPTTGNQYDIVSWQRVATTLQ